MSLISSKMTNTGGSLARPHHQDIQNIFPTGPGFLQTWMLHLNGETKMICTSSRGLNTGNMIRTARPWMTATCEIFLSGKVFQVILTLPSSGRMGRHSSSSLENTGDLMMPQLQWTEATLHTQGMPDSGGLDAQRRNCHLFQNMTGLKLTKNLNF